MLRFKEYLTELFNTSKTKLEWKRIYDGWEASFTLGDYNYFVAFTNDAGVWQFCFAMDDDSIAKKYGDPYAVDSFGVLGTGQAFNVFAVVIQALKEFIQKEHPNEIVFSGVERSRQKLYDRFVKAVGGNIPGYTGEVETRPEYIQHFIGPDFGHRSVPAKLYLIRKKGYKPSLQTEAVKTVRLYHGTRKEYVDSILKNGLRKGSAGMVWATESLEYAKTFAKNLSYGMKVSIEPAVVAIDAPAGSFFWERPYTPGAKSIKGERVARFVTAVPAEWISLV